MARRADSPEVARGLITSMTTTTTKDSTRTQAFRDVKQPCGWLIRNPQCRWHVVCPSHDVKTRPTVVSGWLVACWQSANAAVYCVTLINSDNGGNDVLE